MSAAPNQRVQVSRVPSKPVRRQGDGRIAIDLWLRRDGVFDADAALSLTTAEAELLHAQLCYALDGEPATDRVPDCRTPSTARRVPTRDVREGPHTWS
ncbi:hypothetical protein [Streptomyces sp. NRRL F-5065]|uniref:hypothetical protein n=1 Tax=Streptomyces sp. NRRL F-5065 TaxID=1463855 RepID=UPI0018FE2CEF|nr:hypothetical protein [Streptomyces sp. NRRL F-5065]